MSHDHNHDHARLFYVVEVNRDMRNRIAHPGLLQEAIESVQPDLGDILRYGIVGTSSATGSSPPLTRAPLVSRPRRAGRMCLTGACKPRLRAPKIQETDESFGGRALWYTLSPRWPLSSDPRAASARTATANRGNPPRSRSPQPLDRVSAAEMTRTVQLFS